MQLLRVRQGGCVRLAPPCARRLLQLKRQRWLQRTHRRWQQDWRVPLADGRSSHRGIQHRFQWSGGEGVAVDGENFV